MVGVTKVQCNCYHNKLPSTTGIEIRYIIINSDKDRRSFEHLLNDKSDNWNEDAEDAIRAATNEIFDIEVDVFP